MGNIAIIPARGGSKRIPKKNIKDFLGKPIISYSIEAALKSNLFEKVIVSTDDEEIAAIALKYGAEVPFMRSDVNAGDFSTTADVLIEVLNSYNTLGKSFDYVCCIYPTAPFTDEIKLKLAFTRLVEQKLDSIFPIMPFSFPIQRAVKITNEKIVFFNPEFENTRSQDLEPAYHDAGQFYFFVAKTFIETKKIVSINTGYILISETEAQDIDNKTDWELAELKFTRNIKK